MTEASKVKSLAQGHPTEIFKLLTMTLHCLSPSEPCTWTTGSFASGSGDLSSAGPSMKEASLSDLNVLLLCIPVY